MERQGIFMTHYKLLIRVCQVCHGVLVFFVIL
jgi:hypothetical protein